ncbi:MAG: ABC transporter permease [Anaerolineae bacterium]|nr:ABC transporter permease [Anaerolineae bacterium]
MWGYVLRRVSYMLLTIWALSFVVFVIIQLPPGDYLSTYISSQQAQGNTFDDAAIAALRRQYGLDGTFFDQYWKWITNFLQGDMGRSFEWNQPVTVLLAERLPLTMILSISTLIFVYIVAIPIGIYSALNQYSLGDYVFSTIGFIGLAIPNFMLALILMYVLFKYFGLSAGGLFSDQYATAPWSLGKVLDLFQHLWVPVIVIGMAGTAGLIRVMRGSLLDELGKQYVVTARAKGVRERRLIFKYPVRIAINPIVSTIGWQLPRIVSGETIVAIVLSLPTTGPLLYRALLSQDMYLAGSIVLTLGVLTLVGTFISDILLVMVDPRISFEKKA